MVDKESYKDVSLPRKGTKTSFSEPLESLDSTSGLNLIPVLLSLTWPSLQTDGESEIGTDWV